MNTEKLTHLANTIDDVRETLELEEFWAIRFGDKHEELTDAILALRQAYRKVAALAKSGKKDVTFVMAPELLGKAYNEYIQRNEALDKRTQGDRNGKQNSQGQPQHPHRRRRAGRTHEQHPD